MTIALKGALDMYFLSDFNIPTDFTMCPITFNAIRMVKVSDIDTKFFCLVCLG